MLSFRARSYGCLRFTDSYEVSLGEIQHFLVFEKIQRSLVTEFCTQSDAGGSIGSERGQVQAPGFHCRASCGRR